MSNFPTQARPAAAPRKGRLWLWITLGVVLLLAVGTGVTLAVVQPWKDDDRTTTTEDPDEVTAKAATQGDVTGDDKGDALYYFHDELGDVKKVTAASNGNGFELSDVAVDPYTEPNDMFFDWDGDGVNEQLEWKYVVSGKQVTLSSSDGDFPGEQTFTASLSSLQEYGTAELHVVNGDFDGDGDQDLAIAGPNDRTVDVSVLLNDGKGTFAAPVLWLSIPNAVINATELMPGDFDKDGDADLWAELPSDRLSDEDYSSSYSGDRGNALLTSTGKTFEASAISETSIFHEKFLVGDVTGDGTTNIIGIDADGYTQELQVTVYDVSSGRLEPVAGFTGASPIGARFLQGAALSDVDGDGDADVVFVVKGSDEAKFTGVQVMKSTGAVFEAALVWADTSTCQDEQCRIEFIGPHKS